MFGQGRRFVILRSGHDWKVSLLLVPPGKKEPWREVEFLSLIC